MESLSDRLKSLGFKTASAIQPAKKVKKKPLQEIIGAQLCTNSMGEFLVRTIDYPYGHTQGKVLFSNEIYFERVHQAARLKQSNVPLEAMIFLDTETSGLSGGTGTFAFLVGIGTFTNLGFHLQQFVMRDPAEESAMLLHLTNVIRPDSVFVTFNGKSFDIPLLSNRLVVNRIPANFRENPHVDMLHLARRIWRNQLASCSLKNLEIDVLSMSRSDEEVPGWMIPEIYFDYLRTGEAERLSNVVYHNGQDVVSLAALFIYVSNMLETNADLGDYSVSDLIAIGKIYFEMGSPELAKLVFKACLKKSDSNENAVAVSNWLAKIYKGERKYQDAVKYWVEAGTKGSIEACIELAMFHEHQSKNPIVALQWSENAISLVGQDSAKNCPRVLVVDLEKRIQRLQKKVSKNVL